MLWYQYLFAILLGYLLGSIPSGYLIGRAKGVDIRLYGSGRTGGTNVYRSLGLPYGILTGLSDGAKGLVAVLLARWLFGHEAAAALAGAFAVFGHNWPLFLRFKGGAGGGTAAGSLIALNPLAAAITVPIFLLVLVLGRFASVATISIAIGSTVVLVALHLLDLGTPASHLIFSGLTVLWILWALRPNIVRLWHGTERRIDFTKRQRASQE
ncbi:MAG: glycerol-3-phosphate 1-O-acyltransferase PlsY [Chloroflexi bacterium]|nr:glycerol-3-phosphate 1-O-acyltransferase PlsY [Chloroflexota bacterium]